MLQRTGQARGRRARRPGGVDPRLADHEVSAQVSDLSRTPGDGTNFEDFPFLMYECVPWTTDGKTRGFVCRVIVGNF